jgi:hypothetical protein
LCMRCAQRKIHSSRFGFFGQEHKNTVWEVAGFDLV